MERTLSTVFTLGSYKVPFLSSFLTKEFASQSFTSPSGADLLPGLAPVVCFFPKRFMEQIWMMCNVSNPSILILFICSQLLLAIYLLWRKGNSMLPHLHRLSQNLYDFVLINKKGFREMCLFIKFSKSFSYSSNGWSGLPVVIKVINSKSGLLIDNRTCLPGQEAEDISPLPW